MKLDVYAELASLPACPAGGPLPSGLASGFVDGCTAFAARDDDAKNEARRCYSQRAAAGELRLPQQLDLDPDLARPLRDGWLAIAIAFTLRVPWYSKDDRPFHVLDNPVRKDRVFGVPYMSAASWKGLLRWAFHMRAGLVGPSAQGDRRVIAKAEAMSVHLFGNEKEGERDSQRGTLALYPTWFSKIGFEVINPHDRKARAGTRPITYEVVPSGTAGALRFLYAPAPGAAARDGVKPIETLGLLVDAAEQLLTVYGFSAKRTVGWGVAKVNAARALGRRNEKSGSITDVQDALGALLSTEGASG